MKLNSSASGAASSHGNGPQGAAGLTEAVFLKACQDFLENLDAAGIYTLCHNGSLWVDRDDALQGCLTSASFLANGQCSDQTYVQYAQGLGAVLACDFDGLADSFFSEGQEDENGNLLVESAGYHLLTETAGRRELMATVKQSIPSDLDRLSAALAEIK